MLETDGSYYNARRKLLDENGFEKYPLIIINRIKEADNKIKEIEIMLRSL